MTVRRKLPWLFQRRRREAELAEELQFHLEEEAAERESAGLAPDAARLAARRDLGNATAVAEQTRAAWSWRWLEELAQDLRYSARAMAAAPAFTVLALLSLALGIGANTAIFSFLDSILLRSLPVQDPHSLILLRMHTRSNEVHGMDFHAGGSYDPANGLINPTFSYPCFEWLGGADRLFSGAIAYQSAGDLTVSARGQAALLNGEFVTGNYFRVLGVGPAAGRLITPDDDRSGAAPAVVVSYAAADRHFGGAAAAPGQPILVNNVPFTIAGVTPPEFFGADPGVSPDLYFPLHTNVLIEPPRPWSPPARRFFNPDIEWLNVMARLRPGVTVSQVQGALAGPFQEWMVVNNHRRNRSDLPTLRVDPGAQGLDGLRHQFSKPLYMLMTLVALILALACVNIANLMLARSAARRREMAVRLSIGAGRFRLIRQLLTESVLLALAGGAVGVVIAVWGTQFLSRLLSNPRYSLTLRADLNWHVLAAAVALSVLTGIVFGLAPALESTRVDLISGLKHSCTGDPRRSFFRLGLGRILVVSQIAIALLILVAAGLFSRTLANLESINLGFNRENILTFSLNARQAGHGNAEIVPLYDDLRARFTAMSGVRAATIAERPLIGSGASNTMVDFGGPKPMGTRVLGVGPDFFAVVQIPLRLGRPIELRDRAGVAVVNQTFVDRFLNGTNPIGRRVRMLSDEGKPEIEIIGVAADALYGNNLHAKPQPTMFLAYTQALFGPVDDVVFELRTAGNPLNYVRAVRDIVRQADPGLPVSDVKTQAALVDQTISQQMTFTRVSMALAVLALVIAAVGLYGTVSYNIARRIPEIGIRMALGAQRRRVVWNVLREVLLLAAAGIAVSLPIALTASKLVKSFLYGLERNDPFALTFAGLLLLAAAMLAGFIPARRASRIDPMTALRHE